MKPRYCHDCDKTGDVMEESIQGQDYISCARCGTVIAKIDFDWEPPFQK